MRSGVINYDPLDFPRKRSMKRLHFLLKFLILDPYQVE